jgi:LPS-assembly lipoprotein
MIGMPIANRDLTIVKATSRLLLMLGVCALLSACGFHLRGEAKLAADMQRVYVFSSDPYNGPLKRNVQAALKRSGATIEEKPGAGIAEVRMSNVNVATVVQSIGANARVNEFVMVYHVDLEVVDTAGKVVLTKQPLEQQRSFTFDQTQAIGTGSEQATIQREMERDMAQTVLRKIDSLERRLTQ